MTFEVRARERIGPHLEHVDELDVGELARARRERFEERRRRGGIARHVDVVVAADERGGSVEAHALHAQQIGEAHAALASASPG